MGGVNYARRGRAAPATAAWPEEPDGEEASSWEELPTPPQSPLAGPGGPSRGRIMLGKGAGAVGGGPAARGGAKPSFVSYISPEEVHLREPIEKEVNLHLLPGELLLCEANMVLKYTQEDGLNRGTYGKLICTNFKISFIGDESPSDENEPQFKNKIIGENDITLQCVDQLYGVYDERKKSLYGQLRKYPEKMIMYCKDLRVFHFCLRYTKEEEIKRIVSGIVHQTQTPKLFKRLFLFSYATAAPNEAAIMNRTVMFDTIKDWRQELERTKGNLKFKAVSANEDYRVSKKLSKYFVVPMSVAEENIVEYQGRGVPIWCWSCHNGAALLKMSAFPKEQDDNTVQMHKTFLDRMHKTIHKPPYETLRIDEVSCSLPSLQDIQTAYTKFKQLFLIAISLGDDLLKLIPMSEAHLVRNRDWGTILRPPWNAASACLLIGGGQTVAYLPSPMPLPGGPADNSADFWDTDVKWFSLLEGTNWLEIIRRCLKKAVEVVESLEAHNTNVLLVEETASDLCCVISSLVQVMMDPYCRTKMGFQSLVQKEWIMGGHAFVDRCNHLWQTDKDEAPVFLLFLDCVWQLVQQYPPAFEFTETYLTVLSDNLYIPVFSTFFFNSQHQRDTTMCGGSRDVPGTPFSFFSVWDWSVQFEPEAQALLNNPLYAEKPKFDKSQRKTSRFKFPRTYPRTTCGCRAKATEQAIHSNQLPFLDQTRPYVQCEIVMHIYFPKHQRQLSLPLTQTKPSPKRGFFKEETDHLIKNILGKRISRLINSSDELQSNSREFYDSWHCKPVDFHGLLLPRLEGPGVKVWAQRYLRWIPEAQLPGGGTVATATKILDTMEDVQSLQKKVDEKHNEIVSVFEDMGTTPFLRNPARLSSLFPFAMLQRHSLKPVLPTSTWKDLESEGDLARRDDEFVELGDV